MVDLLLSVFITSQRANVPWNLGNRYDRLDVFKYTLKSYSRMKWDTVNLFVELDTEFIPRANELCLYVIELFGTDNVRLQFNRFTKQHEWINFFKFVYPSNEDRLVWFSQCDDHVFIDFNLDVVNEGFELLKSDTSKYKSLYYSHWPEILPLSGKLGNQERVGNYVKFKATLADAIQVFNLNYLKYLFTQLDWRGREFKKIDNLVLQKSIWCDPKQIEDYSPNIAYYVDDLQTIYVPLRELARHFDGYIHVGIQHGETDEFPLIKLPHELNDYSRTPEMIRKQMRIHHSSSWTKGNTFSVPDEWIEQTIALYTPRNEMHSILTTSYECYGKGVQFMRENLEAVISQTYRPLQCVVSDHSKDTEIEDMIKTLDPKGVDIVYVRYSENYGNAGENWNNALKYATGKTLQYNCMDERLAHPNAIKDALDFMNRNNSQWIAVAQITEPKNTLYIPFWNPYMITSNTLSGPTAVIIRDTLKHITLDPQFFYFIDTEWYYRLWKTAGQPVIFNQVTYIGRIHDLQMTNTFSTPERVELERTRLHEKYGPTLPLS
jgi:hypothetical protein